MAEKWADYEKQIAATKKILSEARVTAAVTKPGASGAMLQNAAIASVFTMSLNPDDTAMGWTERGVAWLVAMFLCVAGPLGGYVWKYGSTASAGAVRAEPTSHNPHLPAAVTAPVPAASNNTFQINGDPIEALRQIAQHIQSKQVPA